MKLYDLSYGDTFTLADSEDTKTPPCAAVPKGQEVYTFHHIDGMYSFIKDSNGNVCHFAAWTEVEKLNVKH